MLKVQQIDTKGQVQKVKYQDKFERGHMASGPQLSYPPFSKHKSIQTLGNF